MSTITGTIRNNEGGVASQVAIVFRYLSNPAIAGGTGIYFVDKSVSTDTEGQFSTVLPMGRYSMTVGQVVTYTIVVPDDDEEYDFTAILDPEVTVTQSVAHPLAVLGLWPVQNINELRNVPNTTANRLAVLYSPTDPDNVFYRWSQSSFSVDNGTTIVKPLDTEADEAGRWLLVQVNISATNGGMDYVADMSELTAIPGSSGNRLRVVIDQSAPHKFWYYVHGELATDVDDVNVFRGDDDLGNWRAIIL